MLINLPGYREAAEWLGRCDTLHLYQSSFQNTQNVFNKKTIVLKTVSIA